MNQDARTPASLATPLGRLVHDATPKKIKPYIKPEATGYSKSRGRLNLRAVAEVLAEHGLDPTVELVKIIESDKLDPEVRAKLLTTLLEYVHPKKKSVEITGGEGGPIQVENVSDRVLLQIAMGAVVLEEGDDNTPLIESK